MKCPSCLTKTAIKHPMFGYVECKSCQDKKREMPGAFVEFTTSQIKDSRREYKKDILQPYRDGVLLKEYIQEYGAQGLDVPQSEIKKARYTMRDTKGWWNRDKSKGGI